MPLTLFTLIVRCHSHNSLLENLANPLDRLQPRLFSKWLSKQILVGRTTKEMMTATRSQANKDPDLTPFIEPNLQRDEGTSYPTFFFLFPLLRKLFGAWNGGKRGLIKVELYV